MARLKSENSARLRAEIASRASTYQALPEVVTLNHTDICNLRCVMCPRNLAQGTHRLDQRVLSHVANQLFPTAKKLVLTTSEGEPLGVDFEFLLECALHFEVKIDAVTNGMLLNRDLYQRARGAFDHLNVSLDSHLPEVYERIRLGASHQRVFGNLAAIAEMRRDQPDDVLLSVSAVVMRSNLPHLEDFIRFAASLGVDGVVLQRFLEDTLSTPAESLLTVCSSDEIMARLDAAAATARQVGVNLFMSEFGRPNVMVAPLREKVAPTVAGQGTCWFVAQNFNVMYSGEVYPCCIPTDHVLGNVHYQDPVEIWNGAPFRKLREDQLSGRGNSFCSGCIHAPQLPSPRSPQLNRTVRKVRMVVAHFKNKLVRRAQTRFTPVIYNPGAPEVQTQAFQLLRRAGRTTTVPISMCPDAVHVDPDSGEVLWLADGILWRSTDVTAVIHERLCEVPGSADLTSSVVFPVGDSVLFGFENSGVLWRYADGAVREALRLADPRSSVRRDGIDVDPGGSIFVGEYGVYPGARCARVYRSTDGGQSFVQVAHFRSARHVHLVRHLPGHGMVVTTGDLASERRLYASPVGKRFHQLRASWSGYTSAACTPAAVHFGTDLQAENGLLRFSGSLHERPEYRRLPADCDAPVRKLIAIDERCLLAWCRVDDDAKHYAEDVWGALLWSADAGS